MIVELDTLSLALSAEIIVTYNDCCQYSDGRVFFSKFVMVILSLLSDWY